MKWFRRLRSFLLAEAYPRRLVLEAAGELIRARILTLRPARDFTRELGTLIDADQPVGSKTVDSSAAAARIGALVAAAGAAMPFRARCLHQSIALRRMLSRRGIPVVVHLGVARDQTDRGRQDFAAHAWVSVGPRVISGDGALEKYATVARFG